ncbi:hypothetical protein ARMSODRAFT_1000849, partial [Armillaria solidipes]
MYSLEPSLLYLSCLLLALCLNVGDIFVDDLTLHVLLDCGRALLSQWRWKEGNDGEASACVGDRSENTKPILHRYHHHAAKATATDTSIAVPKTLPYTQKGVHRRVEDGRKGGIRKGQSVNAVILFLYTHPTSEPLLVNWNRHLQGLLVVATVLPGQNSDSCFHGILVVREPSKSVWSAPPLPVSKNYTVATVCEDWDAVVNLAARFNQQPHSITWAQRHVGLRIHPVFWDKISRCLVYHRRSFSLVVVMAVGFVLGRLGCQLYRRCPDLSPLSYFVRLERQRQRIPILGRLLKC